MAIDIDALEKAHKQATRGPLGIGMRTNRPVICGYPVQSVAEPDAHGNVPGTAAGFSSLDDAEFYVLAHEAMPELVAMYRNVRSVANRLRLDMIEVEDLDYVSLTALDDLDAILDGTYEPEGH